MDPVPDIAESRIFQCEWPCQITVDIGEGINETTFTAYKQPVISSIVIHEWHAVTRNKSGFTDGELAEAVGNKGKCRVAKRSGVAVVIDISASFTDQHIQ